MRWILRVLLILTVGISLRLVGDAAPPGDPEAIFTSTPAKLTDEQWARFYKRFTGKWQTNTKRTWTAGATGARIASNAAPAAQVLTYGPQPDLRRMRYQPAGLDPKIAPLHVLDGRQNPMSTRPDETNTVARVVLDEFVVANTLLEKGRVAHRHTWVLSPDGDAGVVVLMDRDEKGKWSIAGIQHYCRLDNGQCLKQ